MAIERGGRWEKKIREAGGSDPHVPYHLFVIPSYTKLVNVGSMLGHLILSVVTLK